MALTKAKIIKSIQKRVGKKRQHSFKIIETLLEIMKQTLEKGEDITICRFGRFCVKEKKSRKGWNPAREKNMMIDSRRVVVFKYSRKLKERINREKHHRKKDPEDIIKMILNQYESNN